MKKNLILIAIAALLLPPLMRGVWFYRGVPQRTEFQTPDYAALAAPQPPRSLSGVSADDEEMPVSGVVLIDLAHSNRFSMDEIASLTKAVKERGGAVELLTASEKLDFSLRYANAFITLSPSQAFTSDEIRLLTSFVQRGGRLLIFTDATRNIISYDFFSDTITVLGDTDAVNSLLEPFGIVVNNDYLYNLSYNEGNYRNILFEDFGDSGLTGGLQKIAFYGTHSVESPSGLILLRGTESTLSSIDDAHHPAQGGAALSQDGNVAVFGDFTFLTPPYNAYADNALLIENLAKFALSGKPARSLATFPFVFEKTTVQVYLASDLQLNSEMIAALGSLQLALQTVNLEIEITAKPPEGDAIILGTFAPSEELEPFLKKFNLSLNEDREFFTLEGIGDIGKSGSGIVLLDMRKNGNALVLLASNAEDVLSLLRTVYNGYLNECLTQSHLAVCSVGYGGSFSTEEPHSEPEEETVGEEPQG